MSERSFPPPPDRARRARLVARLRAWYRENARDLPWRRTRDPYAIWISEAMLQQTRVETVRDYYRRFLARFPTVGDLARASEEDVLALWSGLGYYRRARSLHAAARLIVEEHGGRFPTERRAVLALPGIGPYTAGALLSIAHDLPEPLVDGNVERVFSRLFGLDAVAGSSELARECWSLAAQLVPDGGGAGEWNQALMELGATVCTPRGPRCRACPLVRSCRGRREGRHEQLPRPKPRPAVVDVELELCVCEDAGRWLLEQRGPGGRMASLWQFPTRELASSGEAPKLFPAAWPVEAGLAPSTPLFEISHGITHHRIRARVRRTEARGERLPDGWRWVPAGEAPSLALTGMAKKVLRRLQSAAPVAEGRS